jgi:hypothetical protein
LVLHLSLTLGLGTFGRFRFLPCEGGVRGGYFFIPKTPETSTSNSPAGGWSASGGKDEGILKLQDLNAKSSGFGFSTLEFPSFFRLWGWNFPAFSDLHDPQVGQR